MEWKNPRGLILSFVLVGLASSAVAGPKPAQLSEDAALNALEATLKRDRAYERRISLDCVTFGTEEKTNKYFGFVLRENHSGDCGGDPETSPVVDRYRVYRASKKIDWLDAVEDKWRPYDPARIRRH